MTTDTKAVARWDYDYLAGGPVEDREGSYVLFTDHEKVVAELTSYQRITDQVLIGSQQMVMSLRSALAAKSAEVEGLIDASRAYIEAESALANREYNGINAESLERLQPRVHAARRDLYAAMEKSNEHQDQ